MSRLVCRLTVVLLVVLACVAAYPQEASSRPFPVVDIKKGEAVFTQVVEPTKPAKAATIARSGNPIQAEFTTSEFANLRKDMVSTNESIQQTKDLATIVEAIKTSKLPAAFKEKAIADKLAYIVLNYTGVATLHVTGGQYSFKVTQDPIHNEPHLGQPTFTGAGFQQVASIVSALAGPDVPAHFATVVVDDEVATLLGLTAWIKKSPAPAYYIPRQDAEFECPASWRFSAYPGDNLLVEVVATMPAATVFELKNAGEPKPVIGLMAGYDVADGEYPFYLGPVVHIGGNFSITVGAALGGGNDAEVGYGVAYDISQIFESFTKVLGGKKEQSSGGGGGGSGSQ